VKGASCQYPAFPVEQFLYARKFRTKTGGSGGKTASGGNSLLNREIGKK